MKDEESLARRRSESKEYMHSVNTSVDVDFTEAMSSTVVDMEEMMIYHTNIATFIVVYEEFVLNIMSR